ncbi:MAG: protein kinase [Elusimicrobiota bacterium]
MIPGTAGKNSTEKISNDTVLPAPPVLHSGEHAGGGHDSATLAPGNPAQIAQVYPVDIARAKANEEFDQMLKNKPERGPLIERARDIFMKRLDQHPEQNFPAAEVNMLDSMFDQQVAYGKAMFGLVGKYPNLTQGERRHIMKSLRGGNLDAIARDESIPANLRADLIAQDEKSGGPMFRGHAGDGKGGIMGDFHLSVMEAYQRSREGPGGSNPNDDFIPAPPGSHGKYMQDKAGNDPGTWELAAREKLGRGDVAGGLSALNKAIGLGAGSEALLLRGGILLEKGDYNGAAADARKALELSPGDKSALFILNATAGRTTASPGELAASDRGSAGSIGSSGASGFAAGGFGTSGGRTVAGMTSASALASKQKLDEARRALAMGDLQAAIALAQQALTLNPGNAEAHGFLSTVYARSGDYKRAIASASAGLALSPRDAALLNSKAFAENRSKQYRDALASSNGAIEADARNPHSYANRAYAYGGLGDRDSMMSDINRAAGIDPRFKKAAADAAALQLPSNADILFLFPGENPEEPAVAAPARNRNFGLVVGAGVLGGLLLALGLLSTVLAPLKESVVSAFTRVTRHGPSVHALEEEATPLTPPSDAPALELVRGQYEIVRQIGAGGMGMVYEGTDRSLGRRVAIKKMRDELRLNPRERERFVIEAKTVASLHHGNIVDIYAIAEEGEDVYLVFEYVDGKTIHDLVQSKGRLSPADSLRITSAIGAALTYAHAHGVIHRDMKPSNVMLTSDGRVKVMDFGIARMAKDAMTRYSMTNNVVGTPPYMAPEQEQGVVRKESDVYSLAICAYEMLTGKLPFIGMGAGMLMNKINMSYIPPSRSIAGLPAALDEVFLKAFQADPDQRYRTPQEFAAALDAALGGIPGRV